MTKTVYKRSFYNYYKIESSQSADHVVPVVMDLVHPTSVIDVGCGTGEWLASFEGHGVQTVMGVDGAYVDSSLLAISPDAFIAHDLTKPLMLEQEFDLVMSLEVAEHLPAHQAYHFVKTLTGLGDVIMFSAAIPQQGGTNHVNEQWPEYWQALFAEEGFVAIDAIRPHIWSNRQVAPYYAQNIFLYVHESRLADFPLLTPVDDADGMSMVHPQMWTSAHDPQNMSVRQLAVDFALALRHKIWMRLQEWRSA